MKSTTLYIDIYRKTVINRSLTLDEHGIHLMVVAIGYTHSAFSFAYESLVARSSVAQADIPPGALIALLQKGLEYTAIEEHINEVYPLTAYHCAMMRWSIII
jgi:hypothetical protein